MTRRQCLQLAAGRIFATAVEEDMRLPFLGTTTRPMLDPIMLDYIPYQDNHLVIHSTFSDLDHFFVHPSGLAETHGWCPEFLFCWCATGLLFNSAFAPRHIFQDVLAAEQWDYIGGPERRFVLHPHHKTRNTVARTRVVLQRIERFLDVSGTHREPATLCAEAMRIAESHWRDGTLVREKTSPFHHVCWLRNGKEMFESPHNDIRLLGTQP